MPRYEAAGVDLLLCLVNPYKIPHEQGHADDRADGRPRDPEVPLMSLETWELLSYVVTVVGLPLAIVAYVFEQRKERANEEEEVYQLLSDNYQDFLKVVLENSDLRLFSQQP